LGGVVKSTLTTDGMPVSKEYPVARMIPGFKIFLITREGLS